MTTQRWAQAFATEVRIGVVTTLMCSVWKISSKASPRGFGRRLRLVRAAFDGLYGRAFQQERDPELQQFLASAIGSHPALEVRLIHGTGDSTIPMENTVEFEKALTDAGFDVRLVTFDGGHHDPPNELSLEVFKEVLGPWL